LPYDRPHYAIDRKRSDEFFQHLGYLHLSLWTDWQNPFPRFPGDDPTCVAAILIKGNAASAHARAAVNKFSKIAHGDINARGRMINT